MERDTIISSNRLFHYTYSKKNLISILKNGFKPKYSLEKLGVLKKDDFIEFISKQLGKEIKEEDISDEFAIPMCCFSDIPLNLVNNHIKIYGEYSIGLKKDWGEKQAICPVLYVPLGGESRFLFELMIRLTHRLLPKIQKKHTQIQQTPFETRNVEEELLTIDLLQYLDNVINLIMYVKPYQGLYERPYADFRDENYKFYDEREWRYKPNSLFKREFLYKEEYENTDFLEVENSKLGTLEFNIDDITDIIVPRSEVEEIRRMITKLDKYKLFDVQKIDSIENKLKQSDL